MRTISARNVNEAMYIGVTEMAAIEAEDARKIAPRDGLQTIEYPMPVCTVYKRPWERVLFSALRDANPFFHLMESLWILAGRQDVWFLTQFNKRMGEFSDNGVTFHAPYGYRLRWQSGDQFTDVCDLLLREPDTRRAVLQIWHSHIDLNKDSKDIPCNDLVFLKIRDGRLNMTVCCRSNDMIWGAYGANAVQFSMIQEYLACRLGVKMGTYRQISDSFHVYLDGPGGTIWERLKSDPFEAILSDGYQKHPSDLGWSYHIPLVDPDEGEGFEDFDRDLETFFNSTTWEDQLSEEYMTVFFNGVVIPALLTWREHRLKTGLASKIARERIQAPDWAMAMSNWCLRREHKNEG
jgi:hypothetical protein